jgi:hypothetical protein
MIVITLQELGGGTHGLRIAQGAGRSRVGGPFQERLGLRCLTTQLQRPSWTWSLSPPAINHPNQTGEKEREPHRSSYLQVAGRLGPALSPQCSIPAPATLPAGRRGWVLSGYNRHDVKMRNMARRFGNTILAPINADERG